MVSVFFFYFIIAIHSMQDWTALWGIELQEKDEKHIGKLTRKNSQIKGIC